MPRHTLYISLLFATLLPTAASASPMAAPSQSLMTDAEIPYLRLGVSTNPAGPFFSNYEATIEYAFTRAHSAWTRMAWRETFGPHELAGTFGYHLWPLSNGIKGIFAGPCFTVASTKNGQTTFEGGIDAGYQHAWGNVLLGLQGSISYVHTWKTQHQGQTWVPRWGLILGYAFM